MSGFIPQTHRCEVGGMPYSVTTAMHGDGISIIVTVPGIGPEEQRNRAYVTEAEALFAAEGIARILIQQCVIFGSPN